MPFQFLRRADPQLLLSFLQDEHPQVIALVLAHMDPEQAAAVLCGLDRAGPGRRRPPASRSWTAPRPTSSSRWRPPCERRLSTVLQPTEIAAVGGLDPLVNIINRSDRATERLIVEGLEARGPELAEEIAGRMFMFEDIDQLEDRAVQLVLRQVDSGGPRPGAQGRHRRGPRQDHLQPVRAGRPRTWSRTSTCSARSGSGRSRRPSRTSSARSARSRSRARSWCVEGRR